MSTSSKQGDSHHTDHPGGAGRDDAAIAAVLKHAGRRPEVPSDVMAEVKSAARSQWRWTLQAERRRRRLRAGGVVGGLLAAAAAMLLTIKAPSGFLPSSEPVATVEVAAKAANGEVIEGLPQLGDSLRAGALVETTGSGMAIRLFSGVAVRLDKDSRVRLRSRSSLELLHGAIYADAGDASPSSKSEALVTVRTDLGTVRDLGTRFAVRLDAPSTHLEVLVRDGSVELEHDDRKDIADGGEALILSPDGSLSRRRIPTSGPLWSWTLEALPTFDADGRPLHDLLVWAAYESGRRLHYASPEVESAASEIVFGSYADLSLQEALETSLASSGLRASTEPGEDELLIVSARASGPGS